MLGRKIKYLILDLNKVVRDFILKIF